MTPTKEMLLRRYGPLAAILAIYAVLLAIFPLQIQVMESYAYAAGVEGYYNLSQTFALAQPGKNLPDISLYHPNHPLGHLLPAVLHRAYGFDAMALFRLRNGISALVFLAFFFMAAMRLVGHRAAVITATLCVMFTYVFWGAALSGETQIPALALLMATTYFLLRFFEPETGGRVKQLMVAAVCYVFAGGSHLSSIMFSLPAGLAALVYSHRRWQWKLYAVAVAVIIGGYGLFYGLLFVRLLHIDSLEMYLRTFFIYDPILQRQYSTADWWLETGYSLLRALSYSDSVWGGAARISGVTVIVMGYIALWRSRAVPAVKFLLIAWPVSQLVVQVAVKGRPDGVNFWLFLLPPFFLAAAFGLRSIIVLSRGYFFLPVIVAVFAASNFFSAILPNSSLNKSEFIYLEKHPEYARNPPLAVVVSQPVLTFAEIWWAGSRLGLRQQEIFFPCCGETDAAARLANWAAARGEFLLMSDEAGPGLGSKVAADDKLHCRLLQNSSGEFSAALIPVTVHADFPAGRSLRKQLRIYHCVR